MARKDMNVLVAGRNSVSGQLEFVDVQDGKILLGESTSTTGVTPGTTISVLVEGTAGAYSAGDVVGGLLVFANAVRTIALGGMVCGMSIVDDAGQDAEMELWLFNATPSEIADNAAFAPTSSDLHQLAGIISTEDGSWCAAGTPSAVYVDKYVRIDLDSVNLHGYLVTRGTPTFTGVNDVSVILQILQD